ncbi:unnamed protein product [Durusdinium trenchii]|uniref:Cytochrome b5 heme-binding domain-containing protein n=1 Tax=Durusdinium trenchii TaxID=1381693 RepID=A0ABP0IX78_9DINO
MAEGYQAEPAWPISLAEPCCSRPPGGRRAPARARRRRLRGATACGPTGRMAPGRRRRPRCNSARRHLPREDRRRLRKHVTGSSLWVAHGGVVYDITNFANEHPGGASALHGAGGQDLEVIWKHYPVHYRKPEVLEALAPYAIGRLSDQSMEELRDVRNPKALAATLPLRRRPGAENLAAWRSHQRMLWRWTAVWAVTLTSSVWWWARGFLRALAHVPLLGQPLAEALRVTCCLAQCRAWEERLLCQWSMKLESVGAWRSSEVASAAAAAPSAWQSRATRSRSTRRVRYWVATRRRPASWWDRKVKRRR